MGTASPQNRRTVKIPQRSKDRMVPTFNLKEQRAVAKMGMAGSLGALVVSGLFQIPRSQINSYLFWIWFACIYRLAPSY